MMTHKTLDELLAATDEHKAAWIVKEILKPKTINESLIDFYLNTADAKSILFWISSPAGTDAIEKAMISLGYYFDCHARRGYKYIFWKQLDTAAIFTAIGSAKPEAIINAAIKALYDRHN